MKQTLMREEMKSFLRLVFTIVPLILFLNVFTPVGVTAQICFNISKVMDTNRNQLVSLRSNIKLFKYNSALQESETYEGKLKYVPSKNDNSLIRIDWISPFQESISIVDGKYSRVRSPGVQENIVGKVNDKFEIKDILAFINIPIKELLKNYRLKYLGQEYSINKIPVWHLELTPGNSETIKSIELWVNSDGISSQIKRSDHQNNSITVLLSDLQLNTQMNRSDFKIFGSGDLVKN